MKQILLLIFLLSSFYGFTQGQAERQTNAGLTTYNLEDIFRKKLLECGIDIDNVDTTNP